MKKMAPHIGNKRGSMLMLTLIVFMVILILGMTMITSMLYSQGENTMQINEQKAYYAALSAVEAVKSYFLNPKLDSSITSPHELVGDKEYTYNLKDQGIDEDTTVTIEITNKGPVPNESSKKYIVIKATGTCQGEKSTVTARMIEEEQKGGDAGIYSSQTVFASNGLTRNYTAGYDLNIMGNIFVDDANMYTNISIGSVDLTQLNENGGGNLYIQAERSGIELRANKLKDVFLRFNGSIHISGEQYDDNKKNKINNIYAKKIDKSNNPGMSLNYNVITGDAQLFIGNIQPNIVGNKNLKRLIVGVNQKIIYSGKIDQNEADEVHIKGADTITAITGVPTKPIQVLYSDATNYEGEFNNVNKIIKQDLSYLDTYEQKIDSVMSGLEQLSEVLRNKPQWSRPDESSGFIRIKKGEEEYSQDPNNLTFFEEYYHPKRKIRLVFCDNTLNDIKIRNKRYNNNEDTWYTYFISEKYAGDQIFFIVENSRNVRFDKMSEDEKFNGLYIYAPKSMCKFEVEDENKIPYVSFTGSIIAKQIIIDKIQGKFIFEEPENIEGIGVPGGTDSTGSSSSTSYIYHFEEYI